MESELEGLATGPRRADGHAWSPERQRLGGPPQSGGRISAEIVARIQQLVAFLFSGRVVPEYGEENFREILIPPYRVMYRVRVNGIAIEVVARGSWRLR